MALANIRQEEDESLHEFMERFSSVLVWVQNLSLKVVLTSMITTLKHGPFLDNICKKLSTTLDKLRERVIKFI